MPTIVTPYTTTPNVASPDGAAAMITTANTIDTKKA